MRGGFDAIVWTLAISCLAYQFFPNEVHNGSWTIYFFAVPFGIQWIVNSRNVAFVSENNETTCRYILKLDALLVATSIVAALISSIIPTIVLVVLLNLIANWTIVAPSWLRTWLFVACLCYHWYRRKAKLSHSAREF